MLSSSWLLLVEGPSIPTHSLGRAGDCPSAIYGEEQPVVQRKEWDHLLLVAVSYSVVSLLLTGP